MFIIISFATVVLRFSRRGSATCAPNAETFADAVKRKDINEKD